MRPCNSCRQQQPKDCLRTCSLCHIQSCEDCTERVQHGKADIIVCASCLVLLPDWIAERLEIVADLMLSRSGHREAFVRRLFESHRLIVVLIRHTRRDRYEIGFYSHRAKAIGFIYHIDKHQPEFQVDTVSMPEKLIKMPPKLVIHA